MTELEQYKNYWNEWHQQWYHSLSDKSASNVSGWTIPKDNGGNKHSIHEYFPEPFWGNVDSKNLKGLFLNINPGQGGEEQNFVRSHNPVVKSLYENKQNNYSDTVYELCQNRLYLTTNWMYEKRVSWLNDLLKKEGEPEVDIFNTILCDLIPWHTKSKSDIAKYIQKKHQQSLIVQKVILPLARIAKTVEGVLNNIVIVRSSLFLDILNASDEIRTFVGEPKEFVVLDTRRTFSKMNSFLSIVEIEQTKFLIFSGGASMALPDVDYEVAGLSSCEKRQKLKDFITQVAR